MFKCIVALTALFPGVLLAAEIWTWVDEAGQRHYSDREVPGATQIEVRGSQTFSSAEAERAPPSAGPQASASPAGAQASAPATVTYTVLDVIKPEPDESLWNIGGNLTVTLATYPALAPEHRIDVMLDGERKEIGARSLEITVPEVWRGEHTLEALIVDAGGEILMRSSPVTFYVHQTSIAD